MYLLRSDLLYPPLHRFTGHTLKQARDESSEKEPRPFEGQRDQIEGNVVRDLLQCIVVTEFVELPTSGLTMWGIVGPALVDDQTN